MKVSKFIIPLLALAALQANADTLTENVEETTVTVLSADTTLNVQSRTFPEYFYLPTVFDTYDMHVTPDSIVSSSAINPAATAWAEEVVIRNRRFRRFKQRYMIDNPPLVEYNINTMPEAPKQYLIYVDPSTAKITVEEININPKEISDDVKPVEIKRRNWLHQFDGMVQFSQAYISPNWYQGGNNSLNAIANLVYNVKLNQAFHPNLLFDNTFQYKLALSNAPEDKLRNYRISEDLFQVNSKFGIKAAKRWYYSATLQFKTQMLRNYKPNTNDLTAAFLSPGELNLGLGMTYEYVSPSKKFNLTASFAPLSYNLKICIDKKVDETLFGIKEGRKTASQYGSNIDCKLAWQLAYNINFTSHLTGFTDYTYLQADWENTLSFTINKYLSTQIYVHMRYDTQVPHIPDSKWQKFQLKEILSFGFAYKIGTV